MLKGISPILPPELLAILSAMGHGDEIVIADGNFPSASHARRLVRCDGHPVPPILDAVLALFPLDQYVERPAALMAVVKGDTTKPVIWDEYRAIVKKHESGFTDFEFVERFAFYERAKQAFAVVSTGEGALYANIILKKGVIKPS
jgi:L-fucose mutarotase